MKHRLDVYVSRDCWACAESRRIVDEMSEQFPEIIIRVIDVDDGHRLPDNVVATPAYTLDGQLLFLGNPYRDRLRQRLAALRIGA